MSSLLAIVPWALFGIMVVFGMIFSIVALRAVRRANDAEDRADAATAALAQMEQRALGAESQINEAVQRAQIAEQRIHHAEDRMQKARDVAKAAEQQAQAAGHRAQQAASQAQQADASLRERRDAAADKTRKADARARSLLQWATQQWAARREPDRQKAQAVQGAFQQQLDAYLQHRAAPIVFRAESEIDRMAAPLIERYAAATQTVQREGDLVRIHFPVDPSLGFRA